MAEDLAPHFADLAARLWQARRDGTTVSPDTIVAPACPEDAYAVQDRIAELSGGTVGAIKVGSTSREAQRLLGTTEPGSCPVSSVYCLDSPARIAISPAHMPAVEGEFAFRLGAPLPARDAPYGTEEVAAAVDAVGGAIEVVGTRIAGGLAGKGRYLVTADSGANIALVTGEWTAGWRLGDLPGHGVRMSINGRPAGEGTGARALDDPINVLVWLANRQSRVGAGLPAGMVVSTGTCTGLDPVAPGDAVVADFGALGRVEIAFTEIGGAL